MSRILASFLLFLFIFCSIRANNISDEYTVYGVVKSDNEEPLVGVTIRIDNSGKGTITDNEGKFSFKVKKGKYQIIATCIGFKAASRTVVVGQNTKLNFTLSEDVVMMNNVIVIGESKSSKVKSGIYAVNAIDVSSKLSSIQSIANEVEKGIGVRIRRDGGVGSNYNLTLNGMGGNSIRYYIDGIPMSSKGADFSLENIPPNIVERVEIYKGVVPAHLGGDALGGAINIITNENKKNYYDLSYRVGSFNTHQIDFNAQIVEPKTGLTVKPTVGYNYSKNNYKMKGVTVLNPEINKFETGDFKRFHDDYRSLFTQLEMGFTKKSWADYAYLTVSMTDVDKDIQTGATQDVVYGAAKRESRSWNIGFRYKKSDFLTKGLVFSVNSSHTWQKSSTIDTACVLYYWNGYHRPTDGIAEISSYPVLRHYYRPNSSIRANLDYKLSEVSSFNLNYLLNATSDRMNQITSDKTKGEGGATDQLVRQFINLSYDLSLFDNKWHNTLFVKEFINSVSIQEKEVGNGSNYDSGYDKDHNKTTKQFTSYGLGSRLKLCSALALKASYEYSVRLPGAMELLGDGDNINANYSLEPEKSGNYNLSLFGNYDLTSKLNLFYEAGFFYRDVHDFIMAVQDRENYTFKNLSRISIKGLESELGFRYNQIFSLKGNLSYEKAVDMMGSKVIDGKPNAAYKQQIPNRPSLYSNINASLSFRDIFSKQDKLLIEYDYEYVKWFYLTWAAFGHKDSKSIIPTQNSHNISATYSWLKNRYSISFECNNIFDTLLYDNYKLQKPGRAMFCKFRLFFN